MRSQLRPFRMPRPSAESKRKLPPGAPRPSQLDKIYDELCALPNVQGCYLGYKRIGTRMTRQLSVVACVDQKPTSRDVLRAARIPRSVEWAISSQRTGALPTDVQVLSGGAFQGRPVLGAGDEVVAITREGKSTQTVAGTLGVAMRHPEFGPVVTTAAHVVGAREFGVVTFPARHEPRVRIVNGSGVEPLTGILHRIVFQPTADYALIGPPPGTSAENLYVDREPLGAPYAPDRRDINQRALVLTATTARQTRLRGIAARVTIQGFAFRELLLTDLATDGGDSGACLVDGTSRVMGLLVGVVQIGGVPRSAFAPVATPFTLESAEFF